MVVLGKMPFWQSQPLFGKNARPTVHAERAAKAIRKAQQGIAGEDMTPERIVQILRDLGYQPEASAPQRSKRFMLDGVRVNLDRVHGNRKGARHLDVQDA